MRARSNATRPSSVCHAGALRQLGVAIGVIAGCGNAGTAATTSTVGLSGQGSVTRSSGSSDASGSAGGLTRQDASDPGEGARDGGDAGKDVAVVSRDAEVDTTDAGHDAHGGLGDGAATDAAADGGRSGESGASRNDASDDGGAGDDASVVPPAIMYVGRFDTSDPLGPWMGWPGTRIVARFNGTAAHAQLTQVDGYSGGPSWFNVIVDGVEQSPFSLEGTSQGIVLCSGLAPGVHTVELEKRTEADLGTVRLEALTFTGGTGLLSPPARPGRRIEFLSNSTIDGFGVLGDWATTCPDGDLPQFDDSRSSLAFFTSEALGAEMVLNAYSGKGLVIDEDPADKDFYEILYPRALPDSPASVWTFQTLIPDAVMISLGGVDLQGLSVAPAGFQAAYDALVGTVRTHYPDASIWLTVWSQEIDDAFPTRTLLTDTLEAIIAARSAAGDDKLFFFAFPEATDADQTGCDYHPNVDHEQAMSALMTAEIQQRLGW